MLLLWSNSYAAGRDAFKGLRHGGRAVIAGLDPFDDFVIPTEPQSFAIQQQKVLGATHMGLKYLAEALEIAASGKIKPLVEVFEKERVADAVAKVIAGDVRFRAVVRY